jgi:sulfate adenylyltransferase subunit 1 (EFTu-like GTPase family)
LVYPAKEFVHVTNIIRAGKEVNSAKKTESVMVSFDREIDLERGGLISDSEKLPHFFNQFQAYLIWFNDKEFAGNNAEYLLKINHRYLSSNIRKINHLIDADTLADYQSYSIRSNQIANVNINLASNVAFDLFSKNKNTGSFLLIDKSSNETLACGVITGLIQNGDDEKILTKRDEFLQELSVLLKKYFGDKSDFDFSI